MLRAAGRHVNDGRRLTVAGAAGQTWGVTRSSSSRDRLRTIVVVAITAIVILGLVLSSFQTV
jgi:hypothetical protein